MKIEIGPASRLRQRHQEQGAIALIRYEFLIKTPERTYRTLCPDWVAVMRLIEDCRAMAHSYGLIAVDN